MYMKEGYARIDVDGETVRIEDYLQAHDNASQERHPRPVIRLLIDRMSVPEPSAPTSAISRLVDSAETAFYEGGGELTLRFLPAGIEHTFSTRFEADGISFEEPSDQLFAFNSPMGACPTCEGWGSITGIDPHLVIPDKGQFQITTSAN